MKNGLFLRYGQFSEGGIFTSDRFKTAFWKIYTTRNLADTFFCTMPILMLNSNNSVSRHVSIQISAKSNDLDLYVAVTLKFRTSGLQQGKFPPTPEIFILCASLEAGDANI